MVRLWLTVLPVFVCKRLTINCPQKFASYHGYFRQTFWFIYGSYPVSSTDSCAAQNRAIHKRGTTTLRHEISYSVNLYRHFQWRNYCSHNISSSIGYKFQLYTLWLLHVNACVVCEVLREAAYWCSYSKPRMFLHSFVSSKYFDLANAGVIGLNVIMMALEFYMMPPVSSSPDYSHIIWYNT